MKNIKTFIMFSLLLLAIPYSSLALSIDNQEIETNNMFNQNSGYMNQEIKLYDYTLENNIDSHKHGIPSIIDLCGKYHPRPPHHPPHCPTPTPVPAAVFLLGTGLVGLLGVRRRNKI
jgi:hypothetical protein